MIASRIMKFGGTSLQDADRIRRAAQIVADFAAKTADDSARHVVVLSALGGVTNTLDKAASQA